MADPVTIATVAMVASTAVSAAGAIQQGQAQAAQGRAQQQAQQYNAVIKDQNARLARQQAGSREEQQRRQSRQLMGQQRAALAQAGIGMMGSALDIEEQSAVRAELDALTIAYEGELQAKGMLAAAQQDLFQGEMALAAGKGEQAASYISAGASLLSGAARYGEYRGGFSPTGTTQTGRDTGYRATATPVSGGTLMTPRRI
jgi:hypothetical protein